MGSKQSVILSSLIHVGVLFLLIVSYEFHSPLPVLQNTPNAPIINATIMSMPLPKSAPVVAPLPKPQPPPAPPIEKKIITPTPPMAKKVVVIPIKKKPVISHKDIEKQLLADIKKESQQKKQKTQKHFAQQMKLLAAKSLQEQMLQEQQRLTAVHAREVQGEVNKYKALILQVISQNWLVPGAANKKIFAELLIRLAPGGTVLDVQLVKSSGNEALDRSAEAAVFKSSPLPVPSDESAFAEFKQFVLKVRPMNVL